jgi:hypothetical protein
MADSKGMKTLSLFALIASTALASSAPAVTGIISRDSTGYLVKAEVIQHYTRLCLQFPKMGDKPGDGVFIVDTDVFHLDTAHFKDYTVMLSREQHAEKGT